MKRILYQIATLIVCAFAIAYIPKGMTQFFVVLFSIVSVISLLKNLYIFFFVPERRRFRKLFNDVEWSLWGFGDPDYSNNFLNEFKEIVENKNGENIESEKNLVNRRFRRFI